jgi:galactokinase
MDQAACLLARAGHALRIDFQPLRTLAVAIPAGAAIVVCDSLVAAEKAGAARDAYNQRVAECGRACRALELLLRDALPGPLENLGALRRLFAQRPLHEFAALLEAAHADPVVVRRARHICREAERVDAAGAALRRGDLPALGALMDASHASCRDDYEISAPALEELVAVAKDAGALGARLTGAGFGGCTVNLIAAAEVDVFLARIARGFYAGRPVARDRAHAFAVVASAGATVQRL